MSNLQGGFPNLFSIVCILFVVGVASGLLRLLIYSMAFMRLACEKGLTPAYEARCHSKIRSSPSWWTHYNFRISLYDQFLVLAGYGASLFGGPWVVSYSDVVNTTERRGILGEIVTVSFLKEGRTVDMDLRVFGNPQLKRHIDFMAVAARQEAERAHAGSIS